MTGQSGGVLILCAVVTLSACSGDAAAPDSAEDDKIAAAVPVDAPLGELTGNAAHGEQLFAQCKACHSLEAGTNGIGPSLAGIVGRKAGTVSGYAYSPANRESDLVWSREVLFGYLEDPRTTMPGTRMTYAGMRGAQDRADLIAFLEGK